MTENYDVVVVGAGPAGYVAAIRAAQLKQKVAIVDRQWLGGVCLNVGCIPSKSLLQNAEVAYILRERGKDFGFSFDNLKLDYPVAVKRSRQNSDRLVKGVGFLMKKNAVTVHLGEARLTSSTSLAVTGADKKITELSAHNIIIATGASAMVPSAWKTDGEKVVTYLGGHPPGEASQIRHHHWLRRHWRRIRHHLARVRSRRHNCGDAASPCPAGGRGDFKGAGERVQEARHQVHGGHQGRVG